MANSSPTGEEEEEGQQHALYFVHQQNKVQDHEKDLGETGILSFSCLEEEELARHGYPNPHSHNKEEGGDTERTGESPPAFSTKAK